MFYLIALVLTAGVVVALDLVSKVLTDGNVTEVIPGFVSFVSSHNTGAGWSLFEGAMWLFIPMAIIFSVGILVFEVFFNNKFKNPIYWLGMGLMLGGIIGNLVDRIAFGYVRDFLRFEFMNFPTFNVADMALTFGVIFIAIYMLFLYEPKRKKFGESEKMFVKPSQIFKKKDK